MVTSPAAGEERKGKRPLSPYDSGADSDSEVVSHPTPAAATATEEPLSQQEAAAKEPKSLVLRSVDHKEMVITEPAARVAKLLRDMVDEGCTKGPIPITDVYSDILERIIEYCEKHAPHFDPDAYSRSKVAFPPFPVEIPPSASDIKPVTYADPDADPFGLKAFDKEFLNVDQSTLFEIILAANFMNIEELLDMACMRVADMMRGKKPEEIRETFGIENDYTEEEEEKVRNENSWAFD